jgi:nucleoside-specific outer membrane channel protein Tsx
MSVKIYSAVIAATLLSTSVSAKQFWSDTSFTTLKGSNYEVGDSDKTVFTLEHASGHSWGNTFTFVDRLHHHNDDNHELYGEVGASINLLTPNASFFKQVYFAPQWEFGSDKFARFDNFLVGMGVNLDVPGAKYFNVNLYRRDNDGADNSNQLTLVWAFPFSNGIVYDGFMDAVDNTDNTASSYNFTSQLKYDIGQHIDVEVGKLFAGVEYVYWNNKFGIDGITEKNANLLIKWHL